MSDRNVALVTGANRGLGFEISRQLGQKGITVLMGARRFDEGQKAAAALREEGLDTRPLALDLTDATSITSAVEAIKIDFDRLDALVNNAAVLLDIGVQPSELEETTLRSTFEVNFFGAYLLTKALVPLLKKSSSARLVNMATQVASLNQLADPMSPLKGDVCPAYQSSKAALNALTLVFAKEFKSWNIKVNSVCPGWVMTDMGSENLPDYGESVRPLTPSEACDTPVWLATLAADGLTGGFYSIRKPIPW